MGYANPTHDFIGGTDLPIDRPVLPPIVRPVPKGTPRRTRSDDDFDTKVDAGDAAVSRRLQSHKRKCNKTLRVPSTTAGEPPTIYRCSRPAGHETFDHPSHQAPTMHEESGHIRFKGQTNLTLYTMQWHEVGAFTWRQE